MKKDKFNQKLREYVTNEISPTEQDRNFISKIYTSFSSLLNQKCLQVGSYSRYTAIKPIHDLDIIYILEEWNPNHNPIGVLKILEQKIKSEYTNPTEFIISISMQTHSITVEFIENENPFISVDIVPGYIFSKNEFFEDKYMVPEILNYHHGTKRTDYYKYLETNKLDMGWIPSDPRGYIHVARSINNRNADFRRTVKIIKAWKNSLREKDDELKIKSFHIEQIITNYFQESDSNIFDGIFNFFINIKEYLEKPRIRDRADETRFIDDYVNDFTNEHRQKIIQAKDCFLKKLEEFTENDEVDNLFEACFYKRSSASEQFLFDLKIQTLTDDNYSFKIFGEIIFENDGGVIKEILEKKKILNNYGHSKYDERIHFRIAGKRPLVDLFKWKVKNDNSSPQPRGEITNDRTLNDPEKVVYQGKHFVECYAILDNICVAKAKQPVELIY